MPAALRRASTLGLHARNRFQGLRTSSAGVWLSRVGTTTATSRFRAASFVVCLQIVLSIIVGVQSIGLL